MGTQVLDPVMPSAFTYKDRCAIQRDSTSDYNRLYTTPSNNVWERLTYDASFRCARTQSAKPYREGAHVPSATGTLSGFASNSTNPSATYTVDSFKPTLQERNDNVMVESLHPLVAKRFKQKEPIQFLMAIRPDTETTNQTMRMMGTYHSDLDQARRFGMHIPAGSPGGAGWYHPDVVLTERRVQTHPAWATATHGPFGFSTNGRFDPANMGQRASLHINMDKARPQSAPRAAQQASSPAAAANGSCQPEQGQARPGSAAVSRQQSGAGILSRIEQKLSAPPRSSSQSSSGSSASRGSNGRLKPGHVSFNSWI